MRIVRLLTARPDRMFDGDLRGQRAIRITSQVRLARVPVDRTSASAGDDMVNPVNASAVRIPLDIVVEQVVVARQKKTDMMRSEQRHIQPPQRFGLWLHCW